MERCGRQQQQVVRLHSRVAQLAAIPAKQAAAAQRSEQLEQAAAVAEQLVVGQTAAEAEAEQLTIEQVAATAKAEQAAADAEQLAIEQTDADGEQLALERCNRRQQHAVRLQSRVVLLATIPSKQATAAERSEQLEQATAEKSSCK